VSGWDQYHDIEALEAQLRARDGRETLDAEIDIELSRIRRMFDDAKRRLGLIPRERDQ
jgi:hypothetical protein